MPPITGTSGSNPLLTLISVEGPPVSFNNTRDGILKDHLQNWATEIKSCMYNNAVLGRGCKIFYAFLFFQSLLVAIPPFPALLVTLLHSCSPYIAQVRWWQIASSVSLLCLCCWNYYMKKGRNRLVCAQGHKRKMFSSSTPLMWFLIWPK